MSVQITKTPTSDRKPNTVEQLKKDPWLRIYRTPGYPPMWKKGYIQKLIRAIAKYTCEVCGAKGKDGVMLDVHHLNYMDKNDCRWENLICVCRNCHSSIHRKDFAPGQNWDNARSPKPPRGLIARGIINSKGVAVPR